MPHDAPDFETEFERAVATYADPSDGGYPQALTARVMAVVDAQRRRRRWWLGISVAVPALACLLVAALLYLRRPELQHQDRASIASTPASATAPETPLPAKPEVARSETVHRRPRPLPKLDQFPAPTPLTEQERLLVQFVSHAPPSTQQLVAKAQKQSDQPLHIADLSIPFLDSSTQPQ
jgi:hypothetical protein